MAIQFYLTDVGRTAALNADNLGLDLQIKNIAVGDAANGGLYDASIEAATMTALDNELERYLVNGGEIEPTTHTLRFTVNLNSTITADIYEIGLFDENNVLFAVASSTTVPLVQLINEVITIITFGFSLDDVDNITLMLDVNSPLAVTLMNQHTAHEHPHAQYKRINDDTERLKVANATDPKDAVNKGQLDAEATTRSNADDNLQNTKAAKNGDNTQRFKVSNAVDADDAVAKNQLDTVANVLPTKANKNGDAAETFSVADGTSASHAVNKGQLDAVAGAIPTLPTIATDTVAGIVEKSLLAELLVGTVDKYPDAAQLLNGFDISKTQDGYIKLPTWLGGLTIQWGYNSNVVDVEALITFPTTFSTVCYNVQCTGDAVSDPDRAEIVSVKNMTKASFTWVGAGGDPSGVIPEITKGWWIAIGH